MAGWVDIANRCISGAGDHRIGLRIDDDRTHRRFARRSCGLRLGQG